MGDFDNVPIYDARGIPHYPTPPAQVERELERRRRERDARIRAAVAERQRMEAELAEQNERRRRDEAAARLESYRQQCYGRFVAAGGTEADFERAWPTLKEQHLIEQATRDPIEELYQRERRLGERP